MNVYVEVSAMESQSIKAVPAVKAFTSEQRLRLASYLNERSDLKQMALLSLLANGYRYNELVSAKVSKARQDYCYFAEISKSKCRTDQPQLYFGKHVTDWIAFASLKPGALLFSSERFKKKPMSRVVLTRMVKSWLVVMGCEDEVDLGALQLFRRKALATRRTAFRT
ncbi:hypothetical protein [Pseudomonas mosselii]|uniref:hypothetical protein n=1 Tax=Pseudomonas mosselii TaxID=78327 RepID=UPI0016480DCE|nr:hypothetical protein [Pseudomonas mosselii]MBC3456940.1 hypothetical protein [Pseudomonas mosselii]